MATRIAWKSIYSVKTTKAGLTYTATKYNILLGLFVRYGSILVCKNRDSALGLIQYLAICETEREQSKAFC